MSEVNTTTRVFGPVPSRRLGRSLGVDLLPFKTCTYDCVYCQLGRTTLRTVERKAWTDLPGVLEELKKKLDSRPDTITLSGSGEPTLHSGLGEMIGSIKRITDIPVTVLTNGSLLWLEEVRRSLLQADLVVPSLDAPDEALFRKANRPHPDIDFDKMVEGLLAFRKEYKGLYWLEVFFLEGINTAPPEVEKMAGIVRRIRPDRVQLNTVTRPPAEGFACSVPHADLSRIAATLGEGAEVIPDAGGGISMREFEAKGEDVLEMLRRRPCTLDDLARGLGIHHAEAAKLVEKLEGEGKVSAEAVGGQRFFKTFLRSRLRKKGGAR